MSQLTSQENDEHQRPFLALGYVREPGKGPLSITRMTSEVVVIATVLYGKEEVVAALLAGKPLEEIIAKCKPLQSTIAKFSLQDLLEVSWFENRSDVLFRYSEQGVSKKATTYMHLAENRLHMLEFLQAKFNQQLSLEKVPARVFQVAWSNILGAVLSLIGTWFFYVSWDPVRLARLRHGKLALLLGREGCSVVGVALFLGCCFYGWRAVRQHSCRFRCIIEPSTNSL